MNTPSETDAPAHLADISFAGQDAVIPFQVEPLDLRGRAVQMGPALDAMLSRHDYPVPVARLLAEAVVLTVLLGTSLKFEGKFIIQTRTDGPVPMLVTEFSTPHSIRAYASFDAEAVEEIDADSPAALLGKGILAMTIDQGPNTQRYQGIVQLDGTDFEDVARQYFRQSEQIPTEVRLAVAQTATKRADGTVRNGWSGGGILTQFLPDSTERMRLRDLPGGDGTQDDSFDEDDAWNESCALMETIEDIELTDPEIASERLLLRLFNQHGVRVYPSVAIRDECRCSRERVRNVLEGFTAEQVADSIEDGEIVVTCEFCSTRYAFDPADFADNEAR